MRQTIQFVQAPIAIPPHDLDSLEIGACVEFQGIVRATEGDCQLEGLNYEAHESMARKLLARHFAELAQIYPCDAVSFIHRLGWVPTGEASLFLRIQSKHRGPALAFCGAVIDRMKANVPIWKMTRHRQES